MKFLPESVSDFFEAAPEVISVMSERFYNDVNVATDALTKVANEVHAADTPERAKSVGRLATEDSSAEYAPKAPKPQKLEAPVAPAPEISPEITHEMDLGTNVEQYRQMVSDSYSHRQPESTPVDQSVSQQQPTVETRLDDPRMAEIAAQIDAAYAEQGLTSEMFADTNILGVNRDSASL